MRREESPWWRAGFSRDWWRALDQEGRAAFLDELTDQEMEEYFRDWRVWARDKQLPPEDDWDEWLICAGRNFGKTRAAVEYIKDEVEKQGPIRIAIVGQGEADIRTVMIEGDSGFINRSPSWNKPKFYPSVGGGQLMWPNGAVGFVYSAEDTEALRGPQFHIGWFDEPMAVPAEKRERAASNLDFCLRLGAQPKLITTTTPKKHRWMKKKLEDAADPENKIHLTRGSTYENVDAPASFLKKIARQYEGTRLGRQELHGEMLGDEEGALWTSEGLDGCRDLKHTPHEIAALCDKVVVAVDPNIQPNGTAHMAGVVVVGRMGKRRYVLADRSQKGGPSSWADAAVRASAEFGANEIVAESNQGGGMVKIVLYQRADELEIPISVHLTFASKGKQRRAEPVAALYERGLVDHVGDALAFEKLETQMTAIHDNYDPTKEDFDRCDALVWGLTRLGVKKSSLSASGGSAGILSFGDFSNAETGR